MKKIIFSAFTLVAVTAAVHAQSLHIGLKLGANLDKVQGQSFQSGFNAGFQGGAFVDIGLGKYVGVSGEVLFNQTDTKYHDGSTITLSSAGAVLSDGTSIKLNYMTIPVLLDLKAAKLLTFQLGPQFGILMNSKNTLLEDGSDAFKNSNIGIVLGARINFGGLRLYGRYIIGVSDISNASSVVTITNPDTWKSQQIQLGIGFTIL